MAKQFIIDQELAQAIANYLQERPFREVAGLINGLTQLVAVEEPKAKESLASAAKAKETHDKAQA